MIVRIRRVEATRRYVARCVEEAKTKCEIIRCLNASSHVKCSAQSQTTRRHPTAAEVRVARTAAG